MSGIIVDNFAGGGGASLGLERALGRPVDVAVNHDAEAVAMHRANHPQTKHFCQSIWSLDPLEAVSGRPVDVAWFSPDCKHFSRAKGAKPVSANIRDLAWVVVHWIERLKPRSLHPQVILLENVDEFRTWGPLVNGRPCPDRRGAIFDKWVRRIRRHGYRVDWRQLRACDYGAPTIRKRLFLVARRDGTAPQWPEPTHGPGLLPYRTAAEIIDWSLPCPSIFDTSAEIFEKYGLRAVRPLKPATMRRIAQGVRRYVIEAAEPFIVGVGGRAGQSPERGVTAPVGTVTAKNDKALVVPHLMTMRNSQKPHNGADEPTHTVTAGGAGLSLVAAFMAQHNGGVIGRPADAPLSTVTQRGTQQQLVAATLSHQYGSGGGDGDPRKPLHTVSAQGNHHALVAAFLTKYYGNGQNAVSPGEPIPTVTAKDRMAVVTVEIDGKTYALTDIGMRMLRPRELFRAQGFPDSYIIDPEVNGRRLSATAQTRMCGNSVCPDLAEAIARANVPGSLAGEVRAA